MDDKTTIVRPRIPASNTGKKEPDVAATDKVAKPSAAAKPAAALAKPPPKPPVAPVKPKAPKSNVPVFALVAFAFVLIGLGSALTTIYLFSPAPSGAPSQHAVVTDEDLGEEIVATGTEESEAEDEALIRAAIKPRIIDLSGDPIITRRLGAAPRQLVKLESGDQLAAASELGVKGNVFRLKDSLDQPDPGLRDGVMGQQSDLAAQQAATTSETDDANVDGSSVIAAAATSISNIEEFAEVVAAKVPAAAFLTTLGLDPAKVQDAALALDEHYQVAAFEKNDQVAVRAVGDSSETGRLAPVQVSVYRDDKWLGTIALSDTEKFTKAADPWLNRDIFEAPLLPEDVRPEDRPRLLDAIYAAALRNRLPAAVIGEAIMLLSRSQDLEQKTAPGDTITLIYAPEPRDAKSGLGRIVYIEIGRTTGSLNCFVAQAAAGARFECVSPDGESADVSQPGMVKPVNGVVVAKFGPKAQPDASGENMNFGVDWTAPKGSPVVAAFDGDVTVAGVEAPFGTVVRLSHANGATTMYGYLLRVQNGLAVGAKIKAGQVVGFVGTPASSREPRLHFELQRNGVPVDPVGEMQASAGSGSGGAVDTFVNRIIYVESGNRCNAKNPLSSATGLGQFIDSTWMTTIRLHRPDLLKGRTRRQVLDMRFNCDLSRAMTQAFTRDNAAVIRQAGHQVTPGHLYLAHFLGVGGAVKVLRSGPNQQIAAVFGEAHVRANPFERGKSIGYLVSWAAKKMGGKTPKKVAQASGDKPLAPANNKLDGTKADTTTANPTAEPKAAEPQAAEPMARYASDPVFAKLKSAVATLLR